MSKQKPKPNFESWNLDDYVRGEMCNFLNGKIDQPVEFIGHELYPIILTHPKHGPSLQECIGLVGQWIDVIDGGAICVYFKDLDEAIVMDIAWLSMLTPKSK